MSLYVYGLAWFVVEASLVYQLVELVQWSLYRSTWLGMRGKGVDTPENHMVQEGGHGRSGLTLPFKPQWVHYKLEVVEKPYSDILAHTREVCKGTPSDQRMPSYRR
jgi:hypothetical protein